jgi:hypothetical protein
MPQKIRWAVLAGAAVAWVAAMIFQGILDNTYVNYPRVPNPEIGRTVPYEVKRVVVYITKDQSAVLDWLRWVEIGSGALILISLILNQKWPPWSNKRDAGINAAPVSLRPRVEDSGQSPQAFADGPRPSKSEAADRAI